MGEQKLRYQAYVSEADDERSQFAIDSLLREQSYRSSVITFNFTLRHVNSTYKKISLKVSKFFIEQGEEKNFRNLHLLLSKKSS